MTSKSCGRYCNMRLYKSKSRQAFPKLLIPNSKFLTKKRRETSRRCDKYYYVISKPNGTAYKTHA